jgi:hypothetical protein
MVARRAHDPEDVGSNPAAGKKLSLGFLWLSRVIFIIYKVSQYRAMVARRAHDPEDVGSNPAVEIYYHL